MENKLKKIIEENGLDILNHPDQLCGSMQEKGISDKNVCTMMLILKCCPGAVTTLSQGEVSMIEANALLRAAVVNTGLSTAAVRKVLGALLHACGVKTNWELHLAIRDRYINKQVMPSVSQEAAASELAQQLKQADKDSAVFSDLHNLAVAGNVQAAYALGKYYKEQDNKDGGNTGEQYFAMAAKLGYGPAEGALADYALRRRHKFMWKIAQRFRQPAALSGQDGREWAPLSRKLLNYRRENTDRIQATLVNQILVLILTLLMVNIVSCGTWGSVALGLQVIGLGWSLVCRFWQPFHSARNACYLMTLSWVILVLAAF